VPKPLFSPTHCGILTAGRVKPFSSVKSFLASRTRFQGLSQRGGSLPPDLLLPFFNWVAWTCFASFFHILLFATPDRKSCGTRAEAIENRRRLLLSPAPILLHPPFPLRDNRCFFEILSSLRCGGELVRVVGLLVQDLRLFSLLFLSNFLLLFAFPRRSSEL